MDTRSWKNASTLLNTAKYYFFIADTWIKYLTHPPPFINSATSFFEKDILQTLNHPYGYMIRRMKNVDTSPFVSSLTEKVIDPCPEFSLVEATTCIYKLLRKASNTIRKSV